MDSKRILVADDEAHILHVVSLKLRNAGFEVITAVDGEEAWELARKQTPDLVITDYQMPFLSGLELAARMRAEPATAEIPVILLTAHGFSIEADQSGREALAAVLSKPFSPREILSKVNELLSVAPA